MEKIQEQLLFNFGEINNLTKGLEARILYESRRNQAIDYFAEQNDDNLSTATLEQMLLWVSKVQKSPIYHPATVAEKLCKIPQLLSRLRKGDESVVQEVALAFSTRNDNRLTRPQMTNALAFCALASPNIFPLVSKGTLEIVNRLWNNKHIAISRLIEVAHVLHCVHSLKEIYCSIKKQWPELSFQDINSTLQSIWVILTDEEVIKLIIEGTIHGSLTALGLPSKLSHLLGKLVSSGFVDALEPCIRKYHNEHLQKLQNTKQQKQL